MASAARQRSQAFCTRLGARLPILLVPMAPMAQATPAATLLKDWWIQADALL